MSVSLTSLPLEIFSNIGKYLNLQDYCSFSVVDQACYNIACDRFFVKAVIPEVESREEIISLSQEKFVSKMGIKWKKAVSERTKNYEYELVYLPVVSYVVTVIGRKLVTTSDTTLGVVSVVLGWCTYKLGMKVQEKKIGPEKIAQGAGETCARIWLSAKSPLRPKTIM